MTIDFLNAQLLVKGETYVITIPDMPTDQLQAINDILSDRAIESQVKFIVLCGHGVAIRDLSKAN